VSNIELSVIVELVCPLTLHIELLCRLISSSNASWSNLFSGFVRIELYLSRALIVVELLVMSVFSIAAGPSRTFPPRSFFEGKDPLREPAAFVQAPWFDRDACRDATLLEEYTSAGWLPGDIPVDLVSTWVWRTLVAVPENAIFVGQHASDAEKLRARGDHVMRGYQLARAMRGYDPFDGLVNLDLGRARWDGEED